VKLLTIYCNIVTFFAKHSLNSISLEIVNRRVELCACTSDRERSSRAGEAFTSDRQPVNGNPDSYSCLCEHTVRVRVVECSGWTAAYHVATVCLCNRCGSSV